MVVVSSLGTLSCRSQEPLRPRRSMVQPEHIPRPLPRKPALPRLFHPETKNMYFPALIIFGSLATAIQPPIVPFFQQAPTPQWGAMKLGVYRFVNLVSGTAISMNDSSADSLIVARYVALFQSHLTFRCGPLILKQAGRGQ